MPLSKSDKPKCVYCGNNPTNHVVSKAIQNILVPATPFFRLINLVHPKFVDRIAEKILLPYIWLFRKLGLWSMSKNPEDAFTERSKVVWREAEARGIEMEEFVIFGKPVEQYRAKINGSWKYFESLPIPPHFNDSSYSWMDDKWMLKKFFQKRKIPVPFGRSVMTWRGALKTFREGKAPFITKPRLGSRGRHTTTKIYTEKDLKLGYDVAKKLCSFVILEEELQGSVYRGTYVNGEIVGILRGDQPKITGDGQHSVKELIARKNETKHPKVKDVEITPLITDFLGRQGYTPDSIIPQGETVLLSEKIGVSYGGFAAEMLPETHPKIISYLKKAGDALNAPVIGFDFIIEDVTKDPDQTRWGIIEANSLPFINLHHFPLEGEPINVAGKVWDLWKKTS